MLDTWTSGDDAPHPPLSHSWWLTPPSPLQSLAPQRYGVILWVLAYFVYYRVQYPTTPNLRYFADFMRWARWKAHPLPQCCKRVGDYLTFLETSPPPSLCPWVLSHPRVPAAKRKISSTLPTMRNCPYDVLSLCQSSDSNVSGRYTTSLSTIGHIVLCTKLTCISFCHK